MRLLEKVAAPAPSMVFEFAMVGFWVVAQHTPFAVIKASPSALILPPLVAVVEEMAEATVVERIGIEQVNVVPVRINGNEFPHVLNAQTYRLYSVLQVNPVSVFVITVSICVAVL